MKIAVISDSHDNIWNLEKVVKAVRGKVDLMVHCGDVIAPFSVKIIASADIPTHVVLGNNDEDHIGMIKKANEKFTWVHIGQQYGEIQPDDKKIAYCHYPRLAELLAKSGEYDAVFYGHTHKVKNEKIGMTLLLNPGAICGIDEGKPSSATYAIYDTATNTAEIVEIK